METKAEYKISNVCTDELNALILEVQDAGKKIAFANEHYGYSEQQCSEAAKSRDALREYVDALVSNGITAQISDLLEQVSALEIVVDSKEQVIKAKQARIDALQAELASETRWAKQYHDQWQAALGDLRELRA